jgi:hypothetical protein
MSPTTRVRPLPLAAMFFPLAGPHDVFVRRWVRNDGNG